MVTNRNSEFVTCCYTVTLFLDSQPACPSGGANYTGPSEYLQYPGVFSGAYLKLAGGIGDKLQYHDARVQCLKEGGRLVATTDPQELEFINYLASKLMD